MVELLYLTVPINDFCNDNSTSELWDDRLPSVVLYEEMCYKLIQSPVLGVRGRGKCLAVGCYKPQIPQKQQAHSIYKVCYTLCMDQKQGERCHPQRTVMLQNTGKGHLKLLLLMAAIACHAM
ncbi:dual specificity protein phosphatase 13 isoform B-like [Platysternon megacephalum]|uniref:Dual specificity protein phosphatase 13 isoform B-like n=1 Tax=Platysternon megacephalum TaxID=55544 RepID=A0A4D9EIM7_9SAUR|nr:dual specificity protein phosphatase 13 isoform B-like [Platysternon megacephalum]